MNTPLIRRAAARSIALAVIATASLLVSGSASAGIVILNSDAEFLASDFSKQFGGEVRWGNQSLNGDWEYGLVNATNTATFAEGNVAWGASSNKHAVEFSYVAAANSAGLSLDGGSLGTAGSLFETIPNGNPNTVLIRIRDTAGDMSELTDIMLTFGNGDEVALGDLIADPGNAKYVGFVDDRVALGFTIDADADLNGGTSRSGSNPAYQFKVGTSSTLPTSGTVPEPSALAVWGLMGLGLIGRRRR